MWKIIPHFWNFSSRNRFECSSGKHVLYMKLKHDRATSQALCLSADVSHSQIKSNPWSSQWDHRMRNVRVEEVKNRPSQKPWLHKASGPGRASCPCRCLEEWQKAQTLHLHLIQLIKQHKVTSFYTFVGENKQCAVMLVTSFCLVRWYSG